MSQTEWGQGTMAEGQCVPLLCGQGLVTLSPDFHGRNLAMAKVPLNDCRD